MPTLHTYGLCPAHPSPHSAAVLWSRPLPPWASRPYAHGNPSLSSTLSTIPALHAVHHPSIARHEAVGHFGTFTLPRYRPLGLERHHQDPGPSGDLAWLLLAQSQRGSLLFPGLPHRPLSIAPSPQPASHWGHHMRCHRGRPLLSACHPRLHPYPQHSPSTLARRPTPTSPRRGVPPPPPRPSD